MTVPAATEAALRRWFNENAGRPRIIAMMSPTCGFCLVGHQAIRTYNAWLPEADMATMRIWVPMMAGDSHDHAHRQAGTTDDDRINDMYDERHVIARLFRDRLGLAAAAWDTYMLFLPGTTWDDETPIPDHHEYQLYPSYAPDQSRLFTPSAFWWRVVEAVGSSQAAYDAQVPALTGWLNDDPAARVGLPVPKKYQVPA